MTVTIRQYVYVCSQCLISSTRCFYTSSWWHLASLSWMTSSLTSPWLHLMWTFACWFAHWCSLWHLSSWTLRYGFMTRSCSYCHSCSCVTVVNGGGHNNQSWLLTITKHLFSPRKRGRTFLPALVCVSVCVFVCLSVTTITKKIVDGFVPKFMGKFLGRKGRPSWCFVVIGRGMWK